MFERHVNVKFPGRINVSDFRIRCWKWYDCPEYRGL